MSAGAMLTLFAIFGCVCGFYLTVVGFAVTSIGIAVLLGIVNPVFVGPFTPGFLVLAFFAQQMGYGLTVIGRGVAQSISRRREASHSASRADFSAERDQSR